MTTGNIPRLPADARARVLASIQKERAPTRAQVLWQTRLLVVIAMASMAAVWFNPWIGFSPDLFKSLRPANLILATSLGAGGISALASLIAFSRGHSMLGRSRGSLLTAEFLSPALLLVWKLAWSHSVPDMALAWAGRPGFECAAMMLGIGIPPFAIALYLRRFSDPVHPAATGSAIGIAVGAIAWTLLELWCPVGEICHLLLGHLLPMILFALAGAIAGRAALAVRLR